MSWTVMSDPMLKALEQSLAEAAKAVGLRPDDEACPECYIAGSVEAFRRQHEAEREELVALRARLAALTAALEGLEKEMRHELTCLLHVWVDWPSATRAWADRLAVLRTGTP